MRGVWLIKRPVSSSVVRVFVLTALVYIKVRVSVGVFGLPATWRVTD